MAKKIADLEEFIRNLKMLGFRKTITFEELRYQIAVKLGYSDYHQKNTLSALIGFSMIKEIFPGVYEYVEKKTPEQAANEAEKEANKLLKDIKHAKRDKS